MAGKFSDKEVMIDSINGIKKSNQFSTGFMTKGLSLNQMQLLSYAIYATQQDGSTNFIKADFEKKFGLDEYRTDKADADTDKLMEIIVKSQDEESNSFKKWNVFADIGYDKGTFSFSWHKDIVPHILDLKDKYVLTDLSVTSNFKSGFSWTLYDYLRGHYGHWFLNITKEALMELFGVSDKKSYQNNTGVFTNRVLDVAIGEINKFTELEVSYEPIKKSRSIVGFKVKWGTGKKIQKATQQQIAMLSALSEEVDEMYLTFLKIEDKDRRERALEILKFFHNMKNTYLIPEVGITAQKSSELISQANHGFRVLNELLERERMTAAEVIFERDKSEKQDGQSTIDDFLK